jgi:hypothetical protein
MDFTMCLLLRFHAKAQSMDPEQHINVVLLHPRVLLCGLNKQDGKLNDVFHHHPLFGVDGIEMYFDLV